MDYSTWLTSPSLDVSLGCGGGGGGGGDNTLRLLDDSPVRDCVNKVDVTTKSSHVATTPLLKHEVGTLMEELNRVNVENKKLTETLTLVCEEYNDLKRKLMNFVGKSYSDGVVDNAMTNNKRRKMEDFLVNHCNNGDINNNNDTKIVKLNNGDQSSSSDEEDSCRKPPKGETLKTKITRVAVRTQASDSTLILKDGYLWRKYGQKVTRDNPCPRAYFKCSFAPSCPVKKKVQRSQEDQSMLVATYEGEHNHAPPPNQETSPNSSRGLTLTSTQCNNDDNHHTTLGSSCQNISLDQTKSKAFQNVPYDTTKSSSSNVSTITTQPNNNVTKFNSPEFQKLLAEQMASSLTKDPNFTAALAAAISGRFSRQ